MIGSNKQTPVPKPDEPFEGDATWRLLQATPRPFTIVDYPRKAPGDSTPLGKILIRLLSQADQTVCCVSAHRWALEAIKDDTSLAYEDEYRNAATLEVLWHACFSASRYQDDGEFRPFFPPTRMLRKTITADECSFLVNAYLSLQASRGALTEKVTDDDLFYWCHLLTTKGAEATANLSNEGLMSLCVAMATKIKELENAQQ